MTAPPPQGQPSSWSSGPSAWLLCFLCPLLLVLFPFPTCLSITLGFLFDFAAVPYDLPHLPPHIQCLGLESYSLFPTYHQTKLTTLDFMQQHINCWNSFLWTFSLDHVPWYCMYPPTILTVAAAIDLINTSYSKPYMLWGTSVPVGNTYTQQEQKL